VGSHSRKIYTLTSSFPSVRPSFCPFVFIYHCVSRRADSGKFDTVNLPEDMSKNYIIWFKSDKKISDIAWRCFSVSGDSKSPQKRHYRMKYMQQVQMIKRYKYYANAPLCYVTVHFPFRVISGFRSEVDVRYSGLLRSV
jgi:hypothetical protein